MHAPRPKSIARLHCVQLFRNNSCASERAIFKSRILLVSRVHYDVEPGHDVHSDQGRARQPLRKLYSVLDRFLGLRKKRKIPRHGEALTDQATFNNFDIVGSFPLEIALRIVE